jgi:hypothetical protein
MKKILFIFLLNIFTPLAFANLPLPSPPSGGFIQTMQACQFYFKIPHFLYLKFPHRETNFFD